MSLDNTAFWDDFLTEGLLPVGRVHLTIKNTNIKTKKNQETGEEYRTMGVQYEIDRHEDIDPDNFRTEKGWMNFYFRGKTVQRFRELYKGLTGRAVQATGLDSETGKPTVDFSVLLDEIKGLGCWTAYIWRKQKDSDELDGGPGWNFAQEIDSIAKPVNPFLKQEETEEDEEEVE